MRTKYNVCSKLWYDINIDFVRRNIRHCCKSLRDFETKIEEIELLGPRIFSFAAVTKNARRSMLEQNKLPFVCMDCLKYEPNSIRHVWNVWSDAHIEHHRNELLNDDSLANYIEFDLGPQCDLACVYCGPWSSTTWAKELPDWEINKVIDPTWKNKVLDYLMEYIQSLPSKNELTFNILVGEPTLIGETYEIVERLKQVCGHFDKKPIMMLTTNLNTKSKLFKRFTNIIEETNDIFSWCVAASIEDIKERAEAIRFGLTWSRFEQNLNALNGLVDKVFLTTTFNNMNFPHFDEFIKWSFEFLGKDNFGKTWGFSVNSVQDGFTDVAYLAPGQINITALKDLLLTYTDSKAAANMLQHLDNLNSRLGTKQIEKEFVEYWDRLSKRRAVNYLEIFPAIRNAIELAQ